MPKVVGSCSPIYLAAFTASPEEQRSHVLCPVCVVCTYMDRRGDFKKNNHLFVSWASPHKGKPVMKQCISHWLAEAIALPYTIQGLQPPKRLRTHSTKGLAASRVLFKGMCLQDICAAVSWSSPLTFVQFYMLDVSALCMADKLVWQSRSYNIP